MRDRPLYLTFLAFLTAFLWAVLSDAAAEHLRFLDPRHALRYAAAPVAFFLMFLWPVLQGREREGAARAAVRRAVFQFGGLALAAVVPVGLMGGMAGIDGPELARCGAAVGASAALGFLAVLLAHRRPERLPWAVLLFALWCAGAPLVDVVGGDLGNRGNWGFWRRTPFGVLAAAEGAGAGFIIVTGIVGIILLALLGGAAPRRIAGAASVVAVTLVGVDARAEDSIQVTFEPLAGAYVREGAATPFRVQVTSELRDIDGEVYVGSSEFDSSPADWTTRFVITFRGAPAKRKETAVWLSFPVKTRKILWRYVENQMPIRSGELGVTPLGPEARLVGVVGDDPLPVDTAAIRFARVTPWNGDARRRCMDPPLLLDGLVIRSDASDESIRDTLTSWTQEGLPTFSKVEEVPLQGWTTLWGWRPPILDDPGALAPARWPVRERSRSLFFLAIHAVLGGFILVNLQSWPFLRWFFPVSVLILLSAESITARQPRGLQIEHQWIFWYECGSDIIRAHLQRYEILKNRNSSPLNYHPGADPEEFWDRWSLRQGSQTSVHPSHFPDAGDMRADFGPHLWRMTLRDKPVVVSFDSVFLQRSLDRMKWSDDVAGKVRIRLIHSGEGRSSGDHGWALRRGVGGILEPDAEGVTARMDLPVDDLKASILVDPKLNPGERRVVYALFQTLLPQIADDRVVVYCRAEPEPWGDNPRRVIEVYHWR